MNAPPRRMLAPASRTRAGDLEEERLALDRARAGDHGQMAAADLDSLGLEDRALGVKLAAGELERLQDRHDLLDTRDRLQRLDLELGLVADHADDRPRHPLAEMRRETQGRDPLEDMLDDLGRRVRLQNNDHLGPRRAVL